MSTPVPAPEIDLDALLTDAVQSMVDDGRGKAILAKASAASAKPFVAKPKYTAAAMVQLMVEHPEYSHTQFAAHFGYQASWFAGVLVSPNLQAALEPRRSEIANPMLTGTLDDLFRALTLQSLTVLQQRLETSTVSEDLIMKAAALGVKALGMGNPGGMVAAPVTPATLSELASRLSQPVLAAAEAKAVTAETVTCRDFAIEASLQELPK